ncbi:MAG: CCA tRNA nucleotidyltransferase [Actinobacteria bacterium]|nr:MAG: CCA tRNA nucleotidyltransferase [Actinomycetota bacterium]
MSKLFKSQQENINKLLKKPIVTQLSGLFTDAGKELYIVGGSVRDAVLGIEHDDLDFTTNALPKDILKIVKPYADEFWDIGAKFGTIGLEKGGLKVEITTYRSEVYEKESRNPKVTFSKTIDEDLFRRDFSINAMAIKLPEGDLVDPSFGFRDLAKGVLKTPSNPMNSFSDDPLRMLRACRFVATFDLGVDKELVSALVKLKERLEIISKERIRDELSKMLLAKDVVKGLRLMVETGLSEYIVPEVPKLKMEIQPQFYHKDVLEHTYRVVNSVPQDLVTKLAALLHDIGKPDTRRLIKGEVHFYGHDVLGARMARKRLFELRFPKKVIEDVSKLIRLHLRPYTYYMGWTDSAVRRYARDAGDLLYKLNALAIADCTTRIPGKAKKNLELIRDLEKRINILEEEEESAKIRPPVDGNEVMEYLKMKPGPKLGEIMNILLEARLDEKIKSKEDAYKMLDKWKKGR